MKKALSAKNLKNMKKYIFVLLLLFSVAAYGQQKQKVTEADYENSRIEMADSFRAEGKIYVVLAIVAVILAGFIVYAVSIDRKLSKLEKEIKSERAPNT